MTNIIKFPPSKHKKYKPKLRWDWIKQEWEPLDMDAVALKENLFSYRYRLGYWEILNKLEKK